LLDACLGAVPPRDGTVVRMGVSPRHTHLESLVKRRGVREYDGLIMAREAAPLPVPGDGWRVEVVDEANRETYRQVLDEAFRHSPNGASITEAQVIELMAEISHADLLGLGYSDGQAAAAFELCLQEDVGWIETVGVARALQGRGLGKAIVASAVERLRAHGVGTIKLLVMSSNEPAVRLYRGCGFEVESVMSRWWRLTP
ncbi:MAG TPA: GNAT family N-acetyltransferase, partial [Oscillatoriaceae cyanobacterium]